MSLNLVLDIVIIALLVPTILYAVSLNKRLDNLRKSRSDLGRLIEAFNEATMRAESGIPKLRQAAEGAGKQLQAQVEKAQSLRDDLAFMIERADSMANRLEESVRSARNETKPSPLGVSTGPAKVMPEARKTSSTLSSRLNIDELEKGADINIEEERSEAEKELLKALKSVR